MSTRDTTVKFRADISDLKAEMQKAQRQIRLVNSEFKAATAGMDDWTKSEEGLAAKIKQLNGILDQQKNKLNLLNKELELTEKEYGKGSAEAQRVQVSINNMTAAITKTEKELNGYNKQLEELPETFDDVGDAAEKASDGFTVFKGALADLAADVVRSAISGLKDLAQEAFNVGSAFESEMSKVGAISGASTEEMALLDEKAQALGESSVFSASEAASAFEYMAMAGWKTEDMLDGVEGVMNLAAAAGTDLATASDIVTDALTAMGYSAQDAGHLADVMAAASSNANTNVEMMGSTFQYAAPIVGALGYNMEDTAVAIGLMANAGIKADKAGTALRSVLTRLSAPPKECAEEMERLGISMTDSEGKMKSLDQIMQELREAFAYLSETESTAAAKHIAGAEAMSGLLAIVNAAPEDYDKLSSAIQNCDGAAADMAETMTDNVGGQLTLLKSKIEGIMIRLFKRASDSMKNGVKTVGEALDKVDWNKVGDDVGKFATKAADLFAYLVRNSSTIISVLKTIATLAASAFIASKITTASTAIVGLVGAFTKAKSVTEGFATATKLLGINMTALPIFAVVTALAALYAAYQTGTAAMKENAQQAYGLTEQEKELFESINNTTEAINESVEARKSEGENLDFAYDKLTKLKDQYNALIDENGNVKEGSEDLADVLLGSLAEGLGTTVDKIKENIDANGKLTDSIDELIKKKKDEAKLAAFEDDYNQALKDEIASFQQMKDAQNNAENAQKKVTEAQEAYNKAVAETQKVSANGFLGAQRMADLRQAKANLEEAESTLAQYNQKVTETKENWGTAQSTIESYQDALAASTEGDTKKMNDALLKLQYGIKDNTVASKTELESQYLDTKRQLTNIQELYANGHVSDAMVEDYKRVNELAGAELDEWVAKNVQAGKDGVEGFANSASSSLGLAYDVAQELGSGSNIALVNGMGDWGEIASDKTGDYLGIFDSRQGEANSKGQQFGQTTADGAKSKTSEFESAAEDATSAYNDTIVSSDGKFKTTGIFMSDKTAEGADGNAKAMTQPGQHVVTTFDDAINAKASEANDAGSNLAREAAAGADSGVGEAETSGGNFAQGLIRGINAWLKDAYEAGKGFIARVIQGVKDKQKEGSPSKVAMQSGEYFAEGYILGIKALTKSAMVAAGQLALGAVESLQDAQEEGSPSKLTYKSGKNFTAGYIKGIASMEKQLVKTTKSLVTTAMKALLQVQDYDFAKAYENASTKFADGMSKKLDFILNKMQYQNEQKIKDFDNTMDKLQAKSDSEIAKATASSQKRQNALQKKIDKLNDQKNDENAKKEANKLKKQLKKEQNALKKKTAAIQKSYDAQIKKQQDMKNSYQQASQAMMSQFSQAMNEYQTAAQKLIDDTMNGITEKYQARYDDLLSKQDSLIDKLKSAGDLFSLSGANVMTINDINAQTAAIKQYAAKLSKIKKKVSGDLFDQIASYDMKEGEAFIDRLLSMSDKELKAYSDAYDEKMKASESLAEGIYKSDFDKLSSDYSKEVKKAFKDLPKQLEALGKETMQGFIKGLTENTAYMDKSIKTFIKGMIATFKKQLGIKSPSKVAMGLGEMVGEGFADGILDMVKTVKDAAKEITDAVTSSLDLGSDLSGAKSTIASATGTELARGVGSFVGDRTQIINFNQVNNSPKALDRLTLYRQTNNILFSAKVGLGNV